MGHEKSKTVEIDGRWYNLDTSGTDKGRILGNKKGYATSEKAVGSAKRRSRLYENKPERHGVRPEYIKSKRTTTKLGKRPK